MSTEVMTTHSGTTYNTMGNPLDGPSSSNPHTLEDVIRDLVPDMRAQINEIKQDMKGAQTLINKRLNELEHPELQPQRECRNPTPEYRPPPPPGYRPPPPLEFRTPIPLGYKLHPPTEYMTLP